MADTLRLGRSAARHGGSSPSGRTNAAIAQLVEHLISNQDVASSILACSTIIGEVGEWFMPAVLKTAEHESVP